MKFTFSSTQYIYIYMGSSYTFFKLLDLNRSNGKKKTFINANILIRISLIILHLLYFISISKPKKSVIFDSLYVSISISFSSTVVPPPWIDCRQMKGKYIYIQNFRNFLFKKKKKLCHFAKMVEEREIVKYI